MNCNDFVCQKLMTCKWDCEIAALWCPAMYSPPPQEKEEPYKRSEDTWERVKPKFNEQARQRKTYRETEIYGNPQRISEDKQ